MNTKKRMIVYYRSDRFYCLCILCISAIIFTSLFNIFYLIQHSFTNPFKGSFSFFGNYSQLNSTTKSDIPDPFHELYLQFLQTFFNSYLPLTEYQNQSVDLCPPVPPDLQGDTNLSIVPSDFSLTRISPYHLNVSYGGQNQPKTCIARHKVALIIPYRDRPEILRHFLFHIHKILQRQQIDYHIFVCEQAYNLTFNKGIVMNGCFKEILKIQPDTRCFIMHDVDLLPINDRNMYTCPRSPRHLSVAIDKFSFYLPYPTLVGGVLAMRREHFLLVNGYSTSYWGWGGEDDDMYERITKKGLKVERPHRSIARYIMLKHAHQQLNPTRMQILRNAHVRIDSDGVNTVKYDLLNTTFFHLYTHFLFDVGNPPK